MNFQVMQQVDGRGFEPAPHLPVYSCSNRAKVAAAELAAAAGTKCKIQPIVEIIHNWHQREQRRFTDGKYKPVVWAGQDWWDKHHKPEHFAHPAIKDQTKIAFTKSDQDGAKDVQTAIKPGKYLKEYFSDVLTFAQIAAYALQHSTTFENSELKFATTPEEIQRVYEPSLGSSCFSGTTKANLYGSGDFAVAYLEVDGVIKARALCAPERKIFVRSYGDQGRLDSILKKAGFEKTGYYDNAKKWAGLRLLKAHHWRGFYADFSSNGVGPHPTEPDKYLVVL